MKKYLLPKNGTFYKAAMHVHTNISDGGLSVAEMTQAYKDKGYSIVAYTDHEVFVTHNDLSDENFLALNGVEISVNDESKNAGGWPYLPTYHLNLYAKRSDIDYSSVCTEDAIYVEHSHAYMTERMKKNTFRKDYTQTSINELIAAANSDGFLVCYNHPVGSLQNFENYCDLKGLWAVEWYNSGSADGGMPETIQPVEDLLHRGEKIMPIAGDDSHGMNLVGKCFAMVKAENLQYETVMTAFEKGDFYSSSGPELYDLSIEDGILHISCSDVIKIVVSTERRVTFIKQTEDYSTFNEAEFDLTDYEKTSHLTAETYQNAYFRVTAYDVHGNEVHSRAYYVTEVFGG